MSNKEMIEDVPIDYTGMKVFACFVAVLWIVSVVHWIKNPKIIKPDGETKVSQTEIVVNKKLVSDIDASHKGRVNDNN